MHIETFLYGLKDRLTSRRLSAATMDMIGMVYDAKLPPEAQLIGNATMRDFMEAPNFHNNSAIVELIVSVIVVQVTLDLVKECRLPGNLDHPFVMNKQVSDFSDRCIQEAKAIVKTLASKKWGPTPCSYTEEQIVTLAAKVGYIPKPPTP